MSAHLPIKAWFTVAELASLALAGLPTSKRKMNEWAAQEGWAFKTDSAGAPLARTRAGRGGGLEYHRSLLPSAAALDFVRRGAGAPVVVEVQPSDAPQSTLWTWFDAQTEAVRAEARERLAALTELEALEAAGMTRTAAVAAIAGRREVAGATLWNWLKLVAGVAPADRLPTLAPRRRGGGAQAELHADAWTFFRTDYLRPEKPTLSACYDRLTQAAAAQGWGALPHVKSLQRRLEREIPPKAIILAREGVEVLRRSLPPQQRTVAELHAMQHVNIDGHRWDVFVRWPDGRIARPMMVAIQDIYSRKMLAWRIAPSESTEAVRLCFADLFRNWGIPRACTLDNGRAFASKWITGGARSRYRFKMLESDPEGLLTGLGVQIHWALPYRGQSKPIERGFRILCEHGAKHPAFAGAYTGNKVDAKPENYGKSAVDLELFRRVVDVVIAAHNAKTGRTTEMARAAGLSYDQVFEASYARSIITKAGPEQLRLALLGAEKVRADRKSGAVRLFENTYWSEALGGLAGQEVVVRFDPDALHGEVHVYDLAGRFVATAPVWGATGFTDVGAARDRARLEADHRRKARAALAAEQLLSVADLAALLPDTAEPAEPQVPTVIRPARLRGPAAAALRVVSDLDEAPRQAPAIDRFLDGAARLRLVE